MGLRFFAWLWGLAEATLFFIVPDVLLSAVALRDRALALGLCLWTLAGALTGGVIMYLWGWLALKQALSVLWTLPAISQAMMASVWHDLEHLGSLATFLGPLTGTPYKLYAALAPEVGISLALFLIISIPARLIRFVLVTLVTAWVARTLLKNCSPRTHLIMLLAAWGLFYLGYFLIMPWR